MSKRHRKRKRKILDGLQKGFHECTVDAPEGAADAFWLNQMASLQLRIEVLEGHEELTGNYANIMFSEYELKHLYTHLAAANLPDSWVADVVGKLLSEIDRINDYIKSVTVTLKGERDKNERLERELAHEQAD